MNYGSGQYGVDVYGFGPPVEADNTTASATVQDAAASAAAPDAASSATSFDGTASS